MVGRFVEAVALFLLLQPIAAAKAGSLEYALILTQVKVDVESERHFPADADPSASLNWSAPQRILVIEQNGEEKALVPSFYSSADADVSFEGDRVLFAGKPGPNDFWNIYEVGIDGSNLRQITNGSGNCRNPIYQSTLYTIESNEPWSQITFRSDQAGERVEGGLSAKQDLYSCKLDGTEVRRLTYSPSHDLDPFLMPDGRILYSALRQDSPTPTPELHAGIFSINSDGTDLSLFTSPGNLPIQQMPCLTTAGLVVFVEADSISWDRSGRLAGVRLARPLKSYEPLTDGSAGLFHSPSPLPDGSILVSRRPSDGEGSHALYRFQPDSGAIELLFDDPEYHDLCGKVLRPRIRPDGRSSVVTESDPNGQIYVLNVSTSDLPDPDWLAQESNLRLRVVEGVPGPSDRMSVGEMSSSQANEPRLLQKRILGELPIEGDGSAFAEIPANRPIQLQLVDAHGISLRSCSWIWVRNHEPRGCIGCHEDGELTPPNRLVDAVKKKPVELTLPEKLRRTPSFAETVLPVISRRCGDGACHRGEQETFSVGPPGGEKVPDDEASGMQLYSQLLSSTGSPPAGALVHPGRARTSPVLQLLIGRDTSRKWDTQIADWLGKHPSLPPVPSNEIRAVAEWIDLGALYGGPPVRGSQSSN